MIIKRILIEYETADGPQRMELAVPEPRTQPPSPTEWWRCPDCHCTGLVDGKYCHCQTGRDLMRVEGRAVATGAPEAAC